MKKCREEIIDDVMHSYRHISQVLLNQIRDAIACETDVHPGLLIILRVLQENGPQSQTSIAKKLSHSGAAVSRQVGILQDKGYVIAERDPANQRVVIVSMTPKGRDTYSHVSAIAKQRYSEILSDVSDELLQEIADANTRLYNKISITK